MKELHLDTCPWPACTQTGHYVLALWALTMSASGLS
jgi:hypothetical protein